MDPEAPVIRWIDETVLPEPEAQFLPLAGISLELGCHFYPEEWAKMSEDGYIPPEHLERGVAEYGRLSKQLGAEAVSTCIFLDGYNGKLDGVIEPSRAISLLQNCAREAGIPLQYIGSESACAGAPADTMLSWIVAPPPSGTNGVQVPTAQKGWISTGLLTPKSELSDGSYKEYNEEVPHSISLAVQIFRDIPARKKQPEWRWWACPYLAAVWQLGRLGLLPAEQIEPVEYDLEPQLQWDDLPLVTRLDNEAPPFSAAYTHTILPKRYMQVVHAEGIILDSLILPSPIIGARVLPSELSRLAEYTLTR